MSEGALSKKCDGDLTMGTQIDLSQPPKEHQQQQPSLPPLLPQQQPPGHASLALRLLLGDGFAVAECEKR